MPLRLGDASTERAQVIAFDPASDNEVCEAAARRAVLEKRGFRLRESTPCSMTLVPPLREPHLGVFRILSESGDDRVVWDRRSPAEVREAFAKFREFIDKGYTAYATTSDGKRSHRIDAFDPGLEEIVLVPKTHPG